MILPKKVILSFHSMDDLSAFKKECACDDFYIDRDALTLVGSFSEAQLKVARDKYRASDAQEGGLANSSMEM
jgi:hypothetical protein